jgi:hypothetical protein
MFWYNKMIRNKFICFLYGWNIPLKQTKNKTKTKMTEILHHALRTIQNSEVNNVWNVNHNHWCSFLSYLFFKFWMDTSIHKKKTNHSLNIQNIRNVQWFFLSVWSWPCTNEGKGYIGSACCLLLLCIAHDIHVILSKSNT